jgi:serine/threonine protein kinase
MPGELLKIGQILQTARSRQPCRVERFLGGGGQGEVYSASLAGKPIALKWYFPHTATRDQWDGLTKLIESGPPSNNDKFLWPIELVVSEGVASFGYLMRLRDPRFKGILDLMSGRTDASFRVLVTAGLQLVDCFFQLHGAGLCYRDISFGNAFFDPQTGEVQVCDNDNVAANNSKAGGVLGTPDFMAPEIVRMESTPDRQTDLYSLAVLLFYMFHIHHPLYGKRLLKISCLDLPARTMLCGTKPLFIFDPTDKSNEAVDDPEAGAYALVLW